MQFLLDCLQQKHLNMIQDNRDAKNISAFGMSALEKCLIAKCVTKSIYICYDHISCKRAYENLYTIFGDEVILIEQREEVLLYKKNVNKNADRISSYIKFASGEFSIAVCTIESLLQITTDIRSLKKTTIEKGKTYKRDDIENALILMGFSKNDIVTKQGEFAMRGDIIDIFTCSSKHPYRLDFFDDTLEEIKQFDEETLLSYENVESCDIFSASDMFLSDNQKSQIMQNLKKQKKSLDYKAELRQQEIIKDITFCLDLNSNITNFCLAFLDEKHSLLSFAPPNTTLIFDEPKQVYSKIQLIYAEHMSRFESLLSSGEVFPDSIKQLLPLEKFMDILQRFTKLSYFFVASQNQFFMPDVTYSFQNTQIANYNQNTAAFISDIKNWELNGYDVVIYGSHAAQNMCNQLQEYGLRNVNIEKVAVRNKGVTVTQEYLKRGVVFHEQKLAIIGTDDIIVKREHAIKRKKRDVFLSPEIGDYVVHPTHGIGKCQGIKQLNKQFGKNDFVVVEYFGGDTLYVPIDQMDLLSKYSGESSPRLNRIGGKEFEKIKNRVKESVRELAFDLHKLYLERTKQIGFAFSPDTPFQKQFEDAFEFVETDDQIKVCTEIKQDMQSPKAMDRLLVGDVGYGKTEVAFRAAFKGIMDSKQVAILCPTTILSEQHYKTALKRFDGFGIRIEVLNRFKSIKQSNDILKRLKNGDVDILIGTHRILGNDVKFNDLGLLVVDEEQRFGVEHKEKIKNIKNGVDVLSMSATPIPRTLHMSMVGIRDISVIETPPQKRLPVQSYVIEQTDAVIHDAIRKELARGGQVFVLDNRVERIDKLAAYIQGLVEECTVVKAHGRMNESALEDAIYKFYNNKANVLCCTTIIENGIDLPNANTLIVLDSDKLGLSQLYQLRGRVGRSDRLAYCYFTTKQGKVLSEVAYKRLSAVMEFADFGSGFKLAMRDLEIRGAGDVLGAKQHGHMDKVGYDMYVKLLADCVDELSGMQRYSVETTIDAQINAYVDDEYINTESERMRVYRRIADCRTIDDKNQLVDEIKDIYGEVPNEVINLINVSLIKKLCSSIGASNVKLHLANAVIEFEDSSVFALKEVINAIQNFSETVMFSVVNKPAIIFSTAGCDIGDIIKNMLNFLVFCKK